MTLPLRSRRVLRNIQQGVPSGVVLGRRSGGEGPAEFIPLDEVTLAQLDVISSEHGAILYRGPSQWEALPAGADGAILQAQGPAANPRWAPVSGGGGGGESELDFSPPTAADLPIQVATATAFTTSVTDVAGKGLTLFLNPSGGGNKTLARLKVPPVAPFTITVRFRQTPHDASDEAGIFLYNSSNQRNLRLLMLSTGQIFGQQWSDLDTFNASFFVNPFSTGANQLMAWFRVTVDGAGGVSFSYSFDGAYFKPSGATTLAAYLTAAGGAFDGVGIHARAASIGGLSSMCCHYYEEA